MNRVVAALATLAGVLVLVAPLVALARSAGRLAVVGLVAMFVLVAVAVAYRRRGTRAGDGPQRAGESGGSFWDLVPSWQYGGLHVESGGQARDEQERALRDVTAQARQRAGASDDPPRD
ncbi:MAG: hypothetical protein ABEJ22_00435 [Haloferacaceae archaeon]